MSEAQRIGPRRYLASSKPRIERVPVSFFRCLEIRLLLYKSLFRTRWPTSKKWPTSLGRADYLPQ